MHSKKPSINNRPSLEELNIAPAFGQLEIIQTATEEVIIEIEDEPGKPPLPTKYVLNGEIVFIVAQIVVIWCYANFTEYDTTALPRLENKQASIKDYIQNKYALF